LVVSSERGNAGWSSCAITVISRVMSGSPAPAGTLGRSNHTASPSARPACGQRRQKSASPTSSRYSGVGEEGDDAVMLFRLRDRR